MAPLSAGTWSNLNTRHPAGARGFYKAIFGWEAASVDFGFGESWMWRRPGYADILEQVATDLGAPFVAAYAQYSGLSQEEYRSWGPV